MSGWAFFTRHDRIGRRNRRNRRRGRRHCHPYSYGGNCSYHNYGDDFSDTDEEEEPPRKPLPIPALKVTRCDYNIDRNTKEHHTDEYDITQPNLSFDGPIRQLVVRRGQPFIITLEFTRRYDDAKDDLRLTFQFGENLDPINGTSISILLSNKDLPLQWGAEIVQNVGNELIIRVFTPPTLFVGKWTFMVDVVKKSDVETRTKVDRYISEKSIYILFNPWCKADTVYMSEEELLDEYILNESGKIFVGSHNDFGSRTWTFGQFEGKILDCVLYLLDDHEDIPLKAKQRGDPILVSRKLSALINSPDDGGVLKGRWDDNYAGGTAPWVWAGSVKILTEFYNTKEPVCFGQCWVFSGVLTTVCRAIGIPARSITNFESAHDTDRDVIIQSVLGSGSGLSFDDSVWNFHVWNDVWMSRPDLPEGYGGWQALDSTPQERSDGLYCCGPCPLAAIKAGDVFIPYDAPFIFAEVNADRVYWRWNEQEQKFKKLPIRKHAIGKNISTKTPISLVESNGFWQNITSDYKHEEGTDLERGAVENAVMNANRNGSILVDELYSPQKEDVRFEFENIGHVMIGEDFEVRLQVYNESDDYRTISGEINVTTSRYTGKLYKNVKIEPFKDIQLSPKERKILKVSVTSSEYLDKLHEHCIFDLSEYFTVKETDQISLEIMKFNLEKPSVVIKAPENVKVGQKIKVDVSFTNPLSVELTGCQFGIEGAGVQTATVESKSNVKSRGTFVDQFFVTPRKKGKRTLTVNFNAKEIILIEGSHDFNIKP